MSTRRSGDEAIAAADARAATTREINIATTPDLPVPADTANVRQGPEIHPDLLALLPLVGVWRGNGVEGNDPQRSGQRFGQQVTVSHDGRSFLRFESVSWLLGADGAPGGPSEREVGFLRPGANGAIELLLVHAAGRVEVWYGSAPQLTQWQFATDGVLRTPTAPAVAGGTRLYGIAAGGQLAYVEELAGPDGLLAPHRSAVLERLAG